MKGLLLKDAYQTWCYIRWIILVSIAMMPVSYTHLTLPTICSV